MPDLQQKRLYAAEATFAGVAQHLTRAEIHKTVRKVCKLYKLPQRPGLRYINEPKNWRGAWMEIELGAPGRNPQLVINTAYAFGLPGLLHELAHLVDGYHFNASDDWHGPRFCGITLWLYDHFKVIPSYAYEMILRKHKCKFWPPSRCSPAKLTKRNPA